MKPFTTRHLITRILGGPCTECTDECASDTQCLSTTDEFYKTFTAAGSLHGCCIASTYSSGPDSHLTLLNQRLDALEAKLDAVLETPETTQKRLDESEEYLRRIQGNIEEELQSIDKARKDLKSED